MIYDYNWLYKQKEIPSQININIDPANWPFFQRTLIFRPNLDLCGSMLIWRVYLGTNTNEAATLPCWDTWIVSASSRPERHVTGTQIEGGYHRSAVLYILRMYMYHKHNDIQHSMDSNMIQNADCTCMNKICSHGSVANVFMCMYFKKNETI